ncbi:MAG: AAA family ATPase [Oligoflexia bacterium]|nr:AAA family ATPase [Oligoflexia bacterium]
MKLGIGYSDFKKIIDQKFHFIDKSLFIKEFLDDVTTEVSVITRPRRFGKTLNLSMLRYFLAESVYGESTAGLFDNLKINNCGKDRDGISYISYQGQNPVIFLTFKDIKETSFVDSIIKLKLIIQNLYREHRHLMNSKKLDVDEKDIIKKYLDGKVDKVDLELSIKILCEFLHKHYQKKVYILLDEYDTPIQSSYIAGYYNEMMDLMRGMLGASLKDNIYLNRAVITGVIRVAKESLFSGLNNIKIYSLMQSKYSQCFGFTEEEVNDLLKKAGMLKRTSDVREWYNGYRFAGSVVYNPWSIVNFIQNNELRSYWVNTSDNALIRDVVIHSSSEFKENLEKILLKKTCEQLLIDEHVVFADLKQNEGAAWSLLVSAGYLNVVSSRLDEDGTICTLEIPNKEIYGLYRSMIKSWLSSTRSINWYNEFLKNLLVGNTIKFAENLEIIFTQIVSVRDFGREPEIFYHGLMLVLVASIDSKLYEISSNRESGHGYHDIMIIPKDENKLGIILELKSVSKIPKKEQLITSALKKSAKEALVQIDKKKYVAGMRQRGIKKVVKIGIAFAGKRLQVATTAVATTTVATTTVATTVKSMDRETKRIKQTKQTKQTKKTKKIVKKKK